MKKILTTGMKRGPKTQYNLQDVLKDFKNDIPIKEMMKTYKLSYSNIQNLKYRHLENKRVLVPVTEKVIRWIERGWDKDIARKKFGEKEFNKAMELIT